MKSLLNLIYEAFLIKYLPDYFYSRVIKPNGTCGFFKKTFENGYYQLPKIKNTSENRNHNLLIICF